MSIKQERVAFATDVFLRRLAIECRKQCPDMVPPIKCIEDLPHPVRLAFIRSMEVAVNSQNKSADSLFLNWQMRAQASGEIETTEQPS